MKLILCVALFCFYSFASCDLLGGHTLSVGCSYKQCGKKVRRAVLEAASSENIKIDFIDLYKKSYPLNKLDILVMPGGADIHPRFYTQNLPVTLKNKLLKQTHLVKLSREGRRRDSKEYNLALDYLSMDSERPALLAICRGMQMLGSAMDIPLYMDLKVELGIKNRYNVFDPIYTENTNYSSLSDFFTSSMFKGQKYHHQAWRKSYFDENRKLWPNVLVTGSSFNQRLIEMIELKDRDAIGTQYHPERSSKYIRKPVFDWLISKGCNRHQQRDQSTSVF